MVAFKASATVPEIDLIESVTVLSLAKLALNGNLLSLIFPLPALFFDFVANDTANHCTTHSANGTASSQNVAAYSANTGTNRSISILRRHPGTPCKYNQQA